MRELAPASSDFLFGPDGALAVLGPAGPKGGDRILWLVEGQRPPRPVGRATAVGFSPDGADLALLSTDGAPGESFGALLRLPRTGGEARLLGERVSEWRFGPRGELLFLSGADVRARNGTLQLAASRDAAPVELARRVQSFQLSARGDRVLFLTHVATKGDFKLELWTAALRADGGRVLAGPPRRIDEGVYGFQLAPDGETLFYKAACAGFRSCALRRVRLGAEEAPATLDRHVSGFELSADGRRLLVARPHRGAPRAVDLALLDAGSPPPDRPPEPFLEEVEPGARFVDPAGRRVLAALQGGKVAGQRAGVRLADLP
jgi:dipeptidyl aminopeptidase/acylaminoacyl peptidase